MEKISRKGFLKIAAAAAMSSVTAAGLAACNAASSSTAAASSGAAGIYTPGTYTATAKGMSEITATVTFDANTITKVELDLSGETLTRALLPVRMAKDITVCWLPEATIICWFTITTVFMLPSECGSYTPIASRDKSLADSCMLRCCLGWLMLPHFFL